MCGLRWPSRGNAGGWAEPGKAGYNSAVLRDLTLSVAEASCAMAGTPGPSTAQVAPSQQISGLF